MRDFRGLKVWQKSYEFTLEVYQATIGFSKDEIYGLTAQIRRSVASVPTNIAEGCGRESNLEFKRFLIIAYSSSNELDYQLLLARDLH
jgi:four helix bundle protein